MHSNVSLSDKVLETIEKEGITPKPKWHFLVREYMVWFFAVLAFCVGGVSTALTIYIANASRFIEHHIMLSNVRFIFQMIPFVWLLLAGVAIFYTVYALRETRKGYKWSSSWIVAIALGISMVLGSLVYASGVSEVLDRYLLTTVPMYGPMSNFAPRHWMSGERGVVAGVVTEVREGGFVLTGIDGREFEIITPPTCHLKVPEIEIGIRIRVEGVLIEDTEKARFEAKEIDVFKGRGGSFFIQPKGIVPPPPQYERGERKVD